MYLIFLDDWQPSRFTPPVSSSAFSFDLFESRADSIFDLMSDVWGEDSQMYRIFCGKMQILGITDYIIYIFIYVLSVINPE